MVGNGEWWRWGKMRLPSFNRRLRPCDKLLSLPSSPVKIKALKIKDGSYSFHQENTELSLAKFTPSLQSKSVVMRSLLVFSFCFRDSFQLQSLPIQVFHAATPVAHRNRQNVVQLWRRQSSLHRVRLSLILLYFLNPSRWRSWSGSCVMCLIKFSAEKTTEVVVRSWKISFLINLTRILKHHDSFLFYGQPPSFHAVVPHLYFSPLSPPPPSPGTATCAELVTLNHKSVSLDGIRTDFISISPWFFISICFSHSYSSEVYFTNGSIQGQLEWLTNDLKKANQPENRAKHPWIIAFGHRPMYCSNIDRDDCTTLHSVVRHRLVGKQFPCMKDRHVLTVPLPFFFLSATCEITF